jgi:hypothetical protein
MIWTNCKSLELLNFRNENDVEYQKNFDLLEKLKKDMAYLYLLGDEFFIELNSTYYKMLISQMGKIILFPWRINARMWMKKRKARNDDDEMLSKLKGKRYYFYIDEISKIVPLNNTFRFVV